MSDPNTDRDNSYVVTVWSRGELTKHVVRAPDPEAAAHDIVGMLHMYGAFRDEAEGVEVNVYSLTHRRMDVLLEDVEDWP